jgi:hypothetical protein
MNKFVEILKTKRDTIVSVLMWEICKVRADAEKEFDRTIDYIIATIKAAKELRNSESTFQHDGGIIAQIRRGPLGVMLNLGAISSRLMGLCKCVERQASKCVVRLCVCKCAYRVFEAVTYPFCRTTRFLGVSGYILCAFYVRTFAHMCAHIAHMRMALCMLCLLHPSSVFNPRAPALPPPPAQARSTTPSTRRTRP